MTADFTIDDLIGLPYQRCGRGPNAYDCYGLCLVVAQRAGIVIPEIPTPTTNTDRNDLFASTKEIWTKLSKPQPFCMAVFKIKRNWHAGVVLPDLQRFIHVMASIRVTVSQLNNFRWRQRFDGYYVFSNNQDS